MTPDAVDWTCKPSNGIRDWTRQLNLSNWSSNNIMKEQGRANEDDKDETEEIDIPGPWMRWEHTKIVI